MRPIREQRSQSVTRNLLREQVADAIRDSIVRGKWKIGQLLPSQAVLAETYSVSVAVIREALQALQAQGLVKAIHGRGTIVIPPDSSRAVDALRLTVDRQGTSLLDLLEFRSSLEPDIAALAAERATPEHLQSLEDSVSALTQSPHDSPSAMQADLDFHQTLAKATGNSILELVVKVFTALYLESMETTDQMSNVAPADHIAIFEAVRDHDPDAARLAMERHMLHGKGDILRAERALHTESGNEPASP